MSYIGIGYKGSDQHYLRKLVLRHDAWLAADRSYSFYGDQFLVMYDSNTTRELCHIICTEVDAADVEFFTLSSRSILRSDPPC